MRPRDPKYDPVFSPMAECKRDITLNANIVRLLASAREYAISEYPQSREIFTPDPTNRNSLQSELDSLREQRAAEIEKAKQNNLDQRIEFLEARIQKYDDIIERASHKKKIAALHEKFEAVKIDPALSEEKKQEKLASLRQEGSALKAKIQEYEQAHPLTPSYLADDVFSRRAALAERVMKAFRKNQKKHALLSKLKNTDINAWGEYRIHLTDDKSDHMKQVLQDEISRSGVYNAFVHIFAKNKLHIAYVQNGKISLIDNEPLLKEGVSMESILSGLPAADAPNRLLSLNEKETTFMVSKIATLATELEHIENISYGDRKTAYQLAHEGIKPFELMQKIDDTVDLYSEVGDKASPRGKLYEQSIQLIVNTDKTISSGTFERKHREKVTALHDSANEIYKECKKYESLGFTLPDGSTPSSLETLFTSASDKLMDKVNALHDLNNDIYAKEKLLTEAFFQDKEDLTQREISAAAEAKAMEEKSAVMKKRQSRAERKEELKTGLIFALNNAIKNSGEFDRSIRVKPRTSPKEKSFFDSLSDLFIEEPAPPSALESLLASCKKYFEDHPADSLSFSKLFKKMERIQEELPATSMAAYQKLKIELDKFKKTFPDYADFLHKEKSLSETVLNEAGQLISEVKDEVVRAFAPEISEPHIPKKRVVVNAEEVQAELKNLRQKREELEDEIGSEMVALESLKTEHQKMLEAPSKLYLKQKLIGETLAIVTASRITDQNTKSKVDFWGTQTQWYIPSPDPIRKLFNPAPTGILAMRKLLAGKEISQLKDTECDEIIKKLQEIAAGRMKQDESSLRTKTTLALYDILSRVKPNNNEDYLHQLYTCTMRLQAFEAKAAKAFLMVPGH